ncbi:hypothetical protein KY343_07290, partial [Candidatus Woesearchaeota archaeon]|nr:hypothetical protein [Candidatus Woesearchaeota archaeon]
MSEFDSDQLIEKKWRDLKLERKFVAYIIRRDYTFVDQLSADVFTSRFYKIFFDIISEKRTTLSKHLLKKVAHQRVPEDDVESCDVFIDKIYSTKIKSTTKKNLKILIDELKKLYESREIITAVGKVIENVDNFNLDKSKEVLRKSLLIESSIVNVEASGDYLEGYERRKKVIKDFQKNPDLSTGILTGIRKFDKISGGIQKGELGIIMAQSGVGKTVCLGNFGMNPWYFSHKNIAFFTLEMTKRQIEFRLDARAAKVQHQKFRKYLLDREDFEKWDKIMKRLREEHDNFFEIIKMPRHTTPDQIEEECKRLQDRKKKKIDLILVDYINLLLPNKMRYKSSQRDWENQGDAAYDLKNIAVDFNAGEGVPIWTPNQVTDSFDPKKGRMEVRHLKYSRA